MGTRSTLFLRQHPEPPSPIRSCIHLCHELMDGSCYLEIEVGGRRLLHIRVYTEFADRLIGALEDIKERSDSFLGEKRRWMSGYYEGCLFSMNAEFLSIQDERTNQAFTFHLSEADARELQEIFSEPPAEEKP